MQTGLTRMEKYFVRPLIIVFGKRCCSNNPQMEGAYKNKYLLPIYITCLIRMAVIELRVFFFCILRSWIQAEGTAPIWACYSCGRGKEPESWQKHAMALKTSAHLPLSNASHTVKIELNSDGAGSASSFTGGLQVTW